MTTRRWIALGVAVVVVVALATWAFLALKPSGGQPPTPSPTAPAARSLTGEEAERLAVARFLAYQDGSREFTVEVPSAEGSIGVHGRVDYRGEVGIAAAVLAGENAVISWDADTLVGWVGEGDGTTVPADPPDLPGVARPLDPAVSTLDAALKLLSSLGLDRPDNAQLLQTSDAQWLRGDDVDGVAVDVFAGPSDPDTGVGAGTTRLWVDGDGILRRFEADLPSGTITLDFDQEAYATVPRAPELG
ncbi:hypothetical protein [Microbacterium sp. 1.5R]|uniref:hypothetical protein n=1 Tax=Microbacterium sp. 1.5R TaxID=1916917 RepID=UPI0011A6969F|nr:hypothetical protein [Microbacterium sp. 1.5R]